MPNFPKVFLCGADLMGAQRDTSNARHCCAPLFQAPCARVNWRP